MCVLVMSQVGVEDIDQTGSDVGSHGTWMELFLGGGYLPFGVLGDVTEGGAGVGDQGLRYIRVGDHPEQGDGVRGLVGRG